MYMLYRIITIASIGMMLLQAASGAPVTANFDDQSAQQVSLNNIPCGVKCIMFLEELIHSEKLTYNDAFKLCNIDKQGSCSLLDLKNALTSLSLPVVARRVSSLNDLAALDEISIFSIRTDGQNHFVIFLKNQNGSLLLADPPKIYTAAAGDIYSILIPTILSIEGFHLFPNNIKSHSNDPVQKNAHITCHQAEQVLGRRYWPLTEPLTAKFMIQNIASVPVSIAGIQTSCGCSPAVAENTVLKPGESTTITMTINEKGRVGGIKKTYTANVRTEVHRNDRNESQSMALSAQVEYVDDIDLSQYEIDFGEVNRYDPKEPLSQTVYLKNDPRHDNSILSASSNQSWISLLCENNRIDLAINPAEMSFGRNFGKIDIVTNRGTISPPVRAHVVGKYTAIPNPVIMDLSETRTVLFSVYGEGVLSEERLEFSGLPKQVQVEEIPGDNRMKHYRLIYMGTMPDGRLQSYFDLLDPQGDIHDRASLTIYPPGGKAIDPQQDDRSNVFEVSEKAGIDLLSLDCRRLSDTKGRVLLQVANITDTPTHVGLEVSCVSPEGQSSTPLIFAIDAASSVTKQMEFYLPSREKELNVNVDVYQTLSSEYYEHNGIMFIPPAPKSKLLFEKVFRIKP